MIADVGAGDLLRPRSGAARKPSIKDFRKNFLSQHATGAKIPEAICSGAEANPLTGSQIELKDFTLEMLRGKETQFFAKAPQCLMDVKEEYATSAGPMQGFTATTNFYIQGVGFLCTKTNSLLVISNQVEDAHRKSRRSQRAKLPVRTNMKTNASVR